MTTEAYFPIEVLALDSVRDDPNNPMVHDDGDMQRLRHSIETHGLLTLPVYNTTTGYIVGGHARVEALRGLGWRKAPFIVVEKDDEAEAAANIALNASYGHHDALKLAEVLRELEAAGIDLDDTGLAPYEIEETLRQAEEALAGAGGELAGDPDDVPDAPEELITKPGDLIILGNHRLLCGDSHNAQDVGRLLSGTKPDMVWTDPSYGMHLDADYSSMSSKFKGSQGGNAYAPVIGDDEPFDPSFLMALLADCPEQFWWGADYYAERIPGRGTGSWLVWDKRLDESADLMFGSCFELCWSKTRHKRDIVRVKWAGIFGMEQEHDRTRHHPTQKPSALAEWFYDRYGKPGDTVLDLFGGSGVALIAAEKTGRTAYLMEMSPAYCDVIVARWEKLTGKTAIRP